MDAIKPWKAVALGALSGALVFAGLRAVSAGPTSLTVKELHSNTKPLIGQQVTITGLAYFIKSMTKHKNGQDVPYTSMSLYEIDQKKGAKGRFYVWISVPSSTFKFIPN